MIEQISDFLLHTDPFSPAMLSVLIIVGFIVGFVNTVAGFATAISYALFMAMGMPITVANGTTRFGVLIQFATSSFIFKKEGVLDMRVAWKAGIPIACGAIFGAEAASLINQNLFEIILAIFMLVMLFLLFYDPKRFLKGAEESHDLKMTPKKFLLFVLIGFYGGFTHVGVGILILFGSVFALGVDLLKASGIKQFAVMLYTPLALIVFAINGQVNWGVAGVYAIGNVIGAVVASRTAIRWGSNFIRWAVAVIILIFSGYLIMKQF